MIGIWIGLGIGVYLSGLIITGAIIYYGIEINELDSFEDMYPTYLLGCIFWPVIWFVGAIIGSMRWLGKKFVKLHNKKEKADA